MTRDDVIRWAREAGFQTGVVHGADGNPVHPLVQPIGSGCVVELERFAAKVAAAEREACAQVRASLGDLIDRVEALKKEEARLKGRIKTAKAKVEPAIDVRNRAL